MTDKRVHGIFLMLLYISQLSLQFGWGHATRSRNTVVCSAQNTSRCVWAFPTRFLYLDFEGQVLQSVLWTMETVDPRFSPWKGAALESHQAHDDFKWQTNTFLCSASLWSWSLPSQHCVAYSNQRIGKTRKHWFAHECIRTLHMYFSIWLTIFYR